MADCTIRVAKVEDAEALLKIYSYYVEETAITFEYEVPSVEEFQGRIRNTLAKYPYFVAEIDGRIVGYCYAGTFKGRSAYDWAVETTVYVDKDCKKSGIGRALYAALEDALRKMHIINANACIGTVVEPDEHLDNNSMEFHEHMGYRLVGEFRKCGYKFGTWYNMVWMEKFLGEHSDTPEPILKFSEI